MTDEFHQNAFGNIANPGSKLRTYSLIKNEIGMEKYLVEMRNMELRTKYTKFRLSNHNLMIEKGRHMGLKVEERVPPYCTNVVEDEIHFLLECDTYSAIRETFLRKLDREFHFFKYFSRKKNFPTC